MIGLLQKWWNGKNLQGTQINRKTLRGYLVLCFILKKNEEISYDFPFYKFIKVSKPKYQ